MPPTVARLASIPHGTTIVVQGTASTSAAAPVIPVASIKPFTIGQPNATFDFPEQTLTTPHQLPDLRRRADRRHAGHGQRPEQRPARGDRGPAHHPTTTKLHVTSTDNPVPGGGTANTAFLKGGTQGPNAVSVSVNATFWLETVQGQTAPTQLQYSQTVLLNFNGLSWPHITVGTLRKA